MWCLRGGAQNLLASGLLRCPQQEQEPAAAVVLHAGVQQLRGALWLLRHPQAQHHLLCLQVGRALGALWQAADLLAQQRLPLLLLVVVVAELVVLALRGSFLLVTGLLLLLVVH